MPTWRKLHVKTTESLDLDAMPDDFTRLLWLMLPLKLCKYGRGLYSPAWVRSMVFPLRDDVTQDMVGVALEWFVKREMLIPYEVEGRAYFFVPSFPRYQGNTSKEANSDYPAPPDLLQTNSGPTPDLLQTNSGTDADADADAKADVDAAAEQEDAVAAISLLEKWGMSQIDVEKLGFKYGIGEVLAMCHHVAGLTGVTNPAGLLISKLKNGDRAPPPKRQDSRRFIGGDYAEWIEH